MSAPTEAEVLGVMQEAHPDWEGKGAGLYVGDDIACVMNEWQRLYDLDAMPHTADGDIPWLDAVLSRAEARLAAEIAPLVRREALRAAAEFASEHPDAPRKAVPA